jgi:hypothetical protein
MNFRYSNFLSNNQEYEKLEFFWSRLFEEFNSILTEEKKWVFWFENKFADGVKIYNANPIFCRINSDRNKGIRVIQDEFDEEAEKGNLIGCWMDVAWESIDELVISCILTDETEAIIRRLIKAYVVDNASPVEMQEIIDAELSNFYPETDQ